MEASPICPSCSKKIEKSWKYCRYCGNPTHLSHSEPEVDKNFDEIKEELDKPSPSIQKSISFDKELYYNVLSSRSDRALLLKEKETVKSNISALLEQIQTGLTTREYALPKIREFKEQVNQISEEEEKYNDLPTELPVEVLIDQIGEAKARLKKIDKLKDDPAVTKEAVKEAKLRAESSLNLLKNEYSTIVGYLKIWKAEVGVNLKDERQVLEQVYIRMKTGELTEDTYKERKVVLSKTINQLVGIERMLKVIIEAN